METGANDRNANSSLCAIGFVFHRCGMPIANILNGLERGAFKINSKSHDELLRERAHHVIPGGMFGHMSVERGMPQGYPQYFQRASGCRLWDVDGNEYIDFMCSYGPMIAGYNNPRICDASNAQRARLDIANGPSESMVDYAEKLVHQISHADWAVFAKNGNDATTLCNMIARSHTEKQNILVGETAYHGSQPWANRRAKGTPKSEYSHYLTYRFNDSQSLADVTDSVSNDLAAIVVSAYRHDVPHRQELVDINFARVAREICDSTGAVLILDDVRAGFRLSLDASWSEHGIQVDLSAWGKALANGEPLAAVVGSNKFREAASSIFFTGSFWYQSAPFAAACETLDLLNEVEAPKYLFQVGQAFRDGLYEQAQRHGFGIHQSGPPQMPMIEFEDDPSKEKVSEFCTLSLKEGVYLHPWHNMFLSVAHTENDIDLALAGTDRAFSKLSF